MTLAAWQEYLGFDRGSIQGTVKVQFDPDTLELEVKVEGDLPICVPVRELYDAQSASPGPFELEGGRCRVRVAAGSGPRRG